MINRIRITLLGMLLVSVMQFPGYAYPEDRLTVYTVNYPLQYFAQRIAGEHADVVFPAPPGVDPAFWTPDAKTIGAYQTADLVLLNGANYAKWINKVSLSRMRMIDTSRAFAGDNIRVDSGTTHSHGAGKEHSHAGTAFTTWLDLQQALKQAEAIKLALVIKRPRAKQAFETNFEQLANELRALDNELEGIVSANSDQPVLASHPVYQYLARRYNMNLHSVMWEPGVFPDESQWNDLKRLIGELPAKWMIWEGEPLAESVARLEQLGIESLVFRPVANIPETGDFLAAMQSNVAALKQVYRQSE